MGLLDNQNASLSLSRSGSFHQRGLSDQTSRGFSAHRLIALIFDSQLASPGNNSPGPLRKNFESGEVADLRKALFKLSADDREKLNRVFGRNSFRSLISISAERDPTLFFADLNRLGGRLMREGKGEAAFLVLSTVVQALENDFSGRPANYRTLVGKAKDQLDLLKGKGSVWGRLEIAMSGFVREATNPISLASMVAAGLAYRVVRLATFSRIAASTRATLFARPLMAHLTASTLGFGAEVTAFVGTGRGLRAAVGIKQDWSSQALLHEFAGAGLMLGALKVTGAGSTFALGRAPRPIGGFNLAGALKRAPYVLIPQTSMLMGIMGAHKIEERLGWRPEMQGASFLFDSLVTLFHFNVAGKMIEGVLGPRYAELNYDLHWRAEAIRRSLGQRIRNRKSLNGNDDGSFGLELAHQTAGGRGRFRSLSRERDLRGSNLLMMSDKEENGGEGGGKKVEVVDGAREVEVGERAEGEEVPPSEPSEEGKRSEISLTQLASARTLASPGLPDQVEVDSAGDSGTVFRPIETGSVREGTDQYVPPSEMARLVAAVGLGSDVTISLKPGTVLPGGKYQVVESIGKGGMGEAFLLTHTELGSQWVLKVMHQRIQNEDTQERFKREIRLGAHLDVRYAARVHDLIDLPGRGKAPIMEFVQGHDLLTIQDGIHRGEREMARFFPIERQMNLFAEICKAVEVTHNNGIIHRDLKPDNIRVRIANFDTMEDSGVVIMDYGIAKRVGELETNGNGSRIPPQTLEEIDVGLTRDGAVPGTPGYMAPESIDPTTFKTSSPRTTDVFSLGVVLYEWLTGVHPFATFRPGDSGRGEPALVVKRKSSGATEINFFGVFQREGLGGPPPPFEKVMRGEVTELHRELEMVARKAMAPRPEDRYQSAEEMRRAVLLAPARLKMAYLNQIRGEMKEIEKRMHEAWAGFRTEKRVLPPEWSAMHRPVTILRNRRKAWRQEGNSLIIAILGTTKGERWPEGQRMMQQVSWDHLLEFGEREDVIVRENLKRQILENAVPDLENGKSSMALALSGASDLHLELRDIFNGKKVTKDVRVRVIPWERIKDDAGNELDNYEEGDPIYEVVFSENQPQMALKAGYYVLEVEGIGYAKMNVPLHITLKDIRQGIIQNRSIELKLDMVPREKVPEGMIVIQGGTGTIGLDIYDEGRLYNTYSAPEKTIQFNTFLMEEIPISVRRYRKEFIEPYLEGLQRGKRLSRKEVEAELLPLLPRKAEKAPIAKKIKKKVRKAAQVAGRFLLGSQDIQEEPNNYYWDLIEVKVDGKPRWVLNDPLEPVDHNGDPLDPNQPTDAMPHKAPQRFLEWTQKKTGLPFRISTIDELEVVARNSFRWNYSWGYEFEPHRISSRFVFEDMHKAHTQPIGKVPFREESGDISLYGVRDLLGNVREFSSTVEGKGEEGEVVALFGGSVATPFGPFFLPTSRTYMLTNYRLNCNGAFRLVLDLEKYSEE